MDVGRILMEQWKLQAKYKSAFVPGKALVPNRYLAEDASVVLNHKLTKLEPGQITTIVFI